MIARLEGTLVRDGRRIIVFEIREDGQGGPDLAVSCLTATGWTAPVNLGLVVNTSAPEYAPMLDAGGEWLNFIRGDTLMQLPVAALEPPAACAG